MSIFILSSSRLLVFSWFLRYEPEAALTNMVYGKKGGGARSLPYTGSSFCAARRATGVVQNLSIVYFSRHSPKDGSRKNFLTCPSESSPRL